MGKGLDDAHAALALALAAVNSASDAFPPLKSVSGGLLFFVQLAQAIQSNKADYGRLLSRIAAIAHDLANVEDVSSSARLAVVLRVRVFKTCLERLQEDLQPVSRPYALRANQHKNIIRSCNEELDRCTRDLSLWADLLLIRDVESLRTTVLEAIAAVGGQVDNLARRSPALAPADLQASEAMILQAIAVLASRVDDSLSQGPTAPHQAVQQATTSNLHLSACLGSFSVQIEASPKSCVLFA